METTDCLTRDAWLTGLIGKAAYRARSDDKALDELGDRLSALRPGPAFVYAKIPALDLDASIRLQKLGFVVVECSLLFTRPLQGNATPGSDITVREAEPGDRDAVADIAARNFVYSRFHLDPRFDNAVANRIKQEWTLSYFSGRRGDAMVVAETNGEVAGFLMLLSQSEATLTIDLIAVDRNHHRKGVASGLIAFAQSLPGGWQRMRVATQSANRPSVRFYENCGFRLDSAGYVLHLHTDEG